MISGTIEIRHIESEEVVKIVSFKTQYTKGPTIVRDAKKAAGITGESFREVRHSPGKAKLWNARYMVLINYREVEEETV